ncbi:hypothetical protein FACS1894186_5920 [Alphaproteobacteria bacterium]|nr:hypothetical protein FACS1894186_5920 [Alphaproteobacteria bacterium]
MKSTIPHETKRKFCDLRAGGHTVDDAALACGITDSQAYCLDARRKAAIYRRVPELAAYKAPAATQRMTKSEKILYDGLDFIAACFGCKVSERVQKINDQYHAHISDPNLIRWEGTAEELKKALYQHFDKTIAGSRSSLSDIVVSLVVDAIKEASHED